jgi:hypothetical protein
MSQNPFLPSKAEVSARTAAKFLVDVPTGELPAFIRQIPAATLAKIAASLDAYAIRAALIAAYVDAIALGFSLADAAGKSATVSRTVRRALRGVADGAPGEETDDRRSTPEQGDRPRDAGGPSKSGKEPALADGNKEPLRKR